jgi:hypothetical protein
MRKLLTIFLLGAYAVRTEECEEADEVATSEQQALMEVEAPRGLSKVAPVILGLGAAHYAGAFQAPGAVPTGMVRQPAVGGAPAPVGGTMLQSARFNNPVMQMEDGVPSDVEWATVQKSARMDNPVMQMDPDDMPSDVESPCDDNDPAVADDSRVTGDSLRSIQLRNVESELVDMADVMGEGKSVVVFLRHLG